MKPLPRHIRPVRKETGWGSWKEALCHEVHPCLLSKASSSRGECSSPAPGLEICGGAALVRPRCSAPGEKQQQYHGRNEGPPHVGRCHAWKCLESECTEEGTAAERVGCYPRLTQGKVRHPRYITCTILSAPESHSSDLAGAH